MVPLQEIPMLLLQAILILFDPDNWYTIAVESVLKSSITDEWTR